MITKYKAGIDADGKIVALEFDMFIDSGWHKELTPEVLMIALWSASSAYKVPHFRATGYVCRTNKVSGTVFRATGRPQSILFMETIIEHIAHTVGKQPDVIRRMNLIGLGELPPCKSVVDTDMNRIWSELEAQSKLAQRRQECDDFNKKNRWTKRGLAVTPMLFGMGLNPKSLMQAGALVHIMTDGSVLLQHSGVELGNGISTKLVQIAALTLGVPMEIINNVETSTSTVPNSTATCGSITTDLAGPAVQDACRQLRHRLEPVRQKLGASASFADVVAAAYAERIDLTAHGFAKTYDVWWDWEKGEGKIHEYYTSGAACTLVEIDSLTGHHRILSTDIVLDVGESINQAIDIGQIEGAFVQGYGFYTMEEMLYDSRGCPITRGPGNYKIPAAGDVPLEFNVSLLKNAPNPKSMFVTLLFF
jgi:xanthine dehydrogenase/oxidase